MIDRDGRRLMTRTAEEMVDILYSLSSLAKFNALDVLASMEAVSLVWFVKYVADGVNACASNNMSDGKKKRPKPLL